MTVKNPKELAIGLALVAGVYGTSVYNYKKNHPSAPSSSPTHHSTPAPTAPVPRSSSSPNNNKVYDALIIGGGVVGLSVAQNLSSRGASVLLLERDVSLAAGASSGNSGLGCTGYDAPVGSLERYLLRRSIRLHQKLFRSFGISHEHIRKCGSLVVAWTPSEVLALPHELSKNVEAGDLDAVLLSRSELRSLEPALSHAALGAVFCPREAVVEPWLVPMGYAASALLHGATIKTSSLVVGAAFDDKAKLWNVTVAETEERANGRSEEDELLTPYRPTPPQRQEKKDTGTTTTTVAARTVINCAGLYGDEVEALTSDDSKAFTITPRKGQFVVFQPAPNSAIPEVIIEPVATQFTKGVIAWKTVWGTVVVGPTAVDQQSKDDRSTDAETIKMLREVGERMIPALKDATVLGTYSGLRPASEHRDYQIYANEDKQWITVAGIRSTGLTASSGIGDYVGDLWEEVVGKAPKGRAKAAVLSGDTATPDKLVGVTDAAMSPLPVRSGSKRCDKVPTLQEMALEYRLRGDGMITLHGKEHRVTHPISSFGMGALGVGFDVDENIKK